MFLIIKILLHTNNNYMKVLFIGTGLILTTYCVRYPHSVPFWRNKMPYSPLKP